VNAREWGVYRPPEGTLRSAYIEDRSDGAQEIHRPLFACVQATPEETALAAGAPALLGAVEAGVRYREAQDSIRTEWPKARRDKAFAAMDAARAEFDRLAAVALEKAKGAR
jgi:hypothetical protein